MSIQVIAYSPRNEVKLSLENDCREFFILPAIVKDSLEDFLLLLDLVDKVDVLVFDVIEGWRDFNRVKEKLDARGLVVDQMILLSHDHRDIERGTILPPENSEALFLQLKQTMENASENTPDYLSIPVETLIHMRSLPFDLYLKVGERFIRRIPAGEVIDEEVITGYKERGIENLYYEKKNNREFSRLLVSGMISQVEGEYESYEEKIRAKDQVYMTTKGIVESLGFKPRIVDVCESVINSISNDVIKGRDNFSEFINQLKKNESTSLRYRIIELTSHIGAQFISFLDLTNNDMKKLVFASMFCDISLSDPEWLHIRSDEQLEQVPMPERQQVLTHALRSAEMVGKYPNAPLDAEKLIRQHHGSLNGVGFPKSIPAKLSPLNKCLIVSEESAYGILSEPHVTPSRIIARLHEARMGTPLEEYYQMLASGFKSEGGL